MVNPYLLMSFLLIFSMQSAHAQLHALGHAHVHGQGQLLVVQEDLRWQFEFVLPAGDVLGFEHVPETAAQQQVVATFIERLSDSGQMMTLPRFCSVLSTVHSLDEFMAPLISMPVNDKPNQSEHQHQTVNSKHQHEASDGQEIQEKTHKIMHIDVNVNYSVACKEAMREVEVVLFAWLPSVQSLHTQWLTEGGQGAITLRKSSPVLAFTR